MEAGRARKLHASDIDRRVLRTLELDFLVVPSRTQCVCKIDVYH